MRLVAFALVCTACYYLLARAELTRWFWGTLDRTWCGKLLRCPACTGFWLGLGLSHVIPTNGHVHAAWSWSCSATLARHAAYGMVLTAITWALMKLALDYGSAPDPEEATDAQADRNSDSEEQPASKPDR